MRRISILIIIAATSFALALVGKRRAEARAADAERAAIPLDAPDSVRLAAGGIRPGRQLVAYVFGSSRCIACSGPALRAAYARLRPSLRAAGAAQRVASVSVVGVAVNNDLGEGLGYLKRAGLESFDEVGVGRAWQNDHVRRLIWDDPGARPLVPQVVVVVRTLAARLDPFDLEVTGDSIVRRVVGTTEIVGWVGGGTPLEGPATAGRPPR